MYTVVRAACIVSLGILVPYVYDRYHGLSTLWANRPGHLERVYEFANHEIKFADRLRNCEDVILKQELGIAFLSCDPGRDRWNTVMGHFHPPHPNATTDNDNGAIWMYNYTSPNALPTRLDLSSWSLAHDLHPLGIAFDTPTSTLYIINHPRSSTPNIAVFHLSFPTLKTTHLHTLSHPLLPAPNALQLLGNGEMYITNDHSMPSSRSPLGSKVETFSGVPGGSVVSMSVHAPASAKVLARLPFANGIVKVNDSMVVVASSSKPGIYLYTINRTHGNLRFETFVRTPAAVDNLSVDEGGKVLMAGHPYAPSLMRVAAGRWSCDYGGGVEEQREACGCWAPSWVGEWSDGTGVRTLLQDDGGEVCSSSTAVRDVKRGVGLVSMLYGKGIVVFKD